MVYELNFKITYKRNHQYITLSLCKACTIQFTIVHEEEKKNEYKYVFVGAIVRIILDLN